MAKIKIGLVGLGKIARDQHIPALRANEAFELVAVASPHARLSDLPNFNDLPALMVDLDFRKLGTQTWSIDIETDSGRLVLSMGGTDLRIDGRTLQTPSIAEYPGLYQRFAALIHALRSDVDFAPLQLVADAFLCGRRIEVAPFVE